MYGSETEQSCRQGHESPRTDTPQARPPALPYAHTSIPDQERAVAKKKPRQQAGFFIGQGHRERPAGATSA